MTCIANEVLFLRARHLTLDLCAEPEADKGLSDAPQGLCRQRGISPVVSPPKGRNVSATCASTASAGWQEVKMSLGAGRETWSCSSIPPCNCLRSADRPLAARALGTRVPGDAVAGPPARRRWRRTSRAASSARSKSPRKPIRVARTPPSERSCRKPPLACSARPTTRKPTVSLPGWIELLVTSLRKSAKRPGHRMFRSSSVDVGTSVSKLGALCLPAVSKC